MLDERWLDRLEELWGTVLRRGRCLTDRRMQRRGIFKVKNVLKRLCVLISQREVKALTVHLKETSLNKREQRGVIADGVRDVRRLRKGGNGN